MPINIKSARDTTVVTWTGQFIETFGKDPAAFGGTADQAAQYVITRSRFVECVNKVENPNTATKPARVARDEARKSLENATRMLVDVIQAWPQMTDEKRAELDITIRDRKPTRKPRPKMAPLVQIASQSGRTINIKLLDSTDPERRGRPMDVAGTSLLSYIGDLPPADVSGWTFEGNTTKTKESITFPVGTSPGAKVWVCAVFYNTRAETGPVSEPLATHIAGVIGFSKAA